MDRPDAEIDDVLLSSDFSSNESSDHYDCKYLSIFY